MKRMQSAADVRLVLQAQTAADLMTPNPVSIRDTATLADAVALLTDKGFSGAPVIDEAGHPIGVVSRADIVAHDRELPNAAVAASASGTAVDSRRRVRDLMTPAVFSIAPDAPASKVVGELLGLKVHRLFVVESNGILLGVITAADVLRHLQPDPGPLSSRS